MYHKVLSSVYVCVCECRCRCFYQQNSYLVNVVPPCSVVQSLNSLSWIYLELADDGQ